MPLAADGDLLLLHRLEQGGLRLGRRAIDFVGQNDVGEQRAGQETKLARAGALVLLDYFRAGDVGRHQVGRELNAVEFERQRVGQRANHQRLGQARHADQQTMAAREQRDEQLLDHLALADDALGHFVGDAAVRFAEPLDGLEIVGFRHGEAKVYVEMQASRALTGRQATV